ncbi:unnamed protein product, partial [Porites evermanni]
TPINYLLVNLAAADICYVTFVTPTIILSHDVDHPKGIAGTILCAIVTGGGLAWTGAEASIFTLLVVAFERYFAVVHPYGNRGMLTFRKVKVIIPGIWILGAIKNVPEFVKRSRFVKENSSNYCISLLAEESEKALFAVYSSIDSVLLILLVLFYSKIVYTFWFKHSDNVLTHQQQGVLRLRKRATLTAVTISAILVISWGADGILHLIQEYAGSVKLSPLTTPITHTIMIFNSAVNPFAYALLNQRFRTKVKQMVCLRSFVTRLTISFHRTPINYLLVNLAAADICYVTFVTPTIILSHDVDHPKGIAGTILCAVVTGGGLAWTGADASILTLLAFAFERYFAVVHPNGNRGMLTFRKVKVIIPGIWILVAINNIPGFMKRSRFAEENSSNYCISLLAEESKKALSAVYSSIDSVLLIVLVLLHSKIVYTLWFKHSDNVLTPHQQGVLALRKRTTLTAVTITAILVITWGADGILHLIHEYAGSVKLSPLALPIAHTIMIFNSVVNPFAYALLNQRFRTKVKEM